MNETWTEVTALMEARAKRSDDDILAEFTALAPLDEASAPSEEAFWEHATHYLALTEISAVRRLKPAAKLILERAEPGDPGSIMRGIRHALERIFDPDWSGLADVCIDAYHSGSPGALVWALDELTILEQPQARPVFEDLLERQDPEHRETAAQGLARLDLLMLTAERANRSDVEILEELAALSPVVDESDPLWSTGEYWKSSAWASANLFEALCDIATERKLRPAISIIFTKACLGNPRNLMSRLHYKFEHIVGEDWRFLQEAAAQAASSPHAGARFWALKELNWGLISSYDFPPAKAIFQEVLAIGPEELKSDAEYALQQIADREQEQLYDALSDAELIGALRTIPVFPDASDAAWETSTMVDESKKLLAISKAAAKRALTEAAQLCMDRAPLGSKASFMYDVCNSVESMVGEANYVEFLLRSAQSQREGARFWAYWMLSLKAEKRAIPFLQAEVNGAGSSQIKDKAADILGQLTAG
jgi:hypothetical protein